MTRRPLALLCAVALLTGCGSADVDHEPPTDANTAILVVDQDAGMPAAAEEYALPDFTLLGDGTAVTRGPDQGILLIGERRTLTADEITGLYRKAGTADLFANRDFPTDASDAGTLTVEIASGGSTYRTVVAQPSKNDNGDRGQVIDLADAAKRSGTPTGTYQPTRAAVIVVEADGDSTDIRPWPLPVPLSQLTGAPQWPCHLVEGSALGPMLELARSARPESRWLSEGQQVALVVRPLLPHEHTCADVTR
jgi:hypothetical protein